MILGCPKCRTRFRIDDAKVRSAGVKVRCSRCAHVFIATPDQGEPEPSGADTQTRRVDAAALIAMALETAPEPDLDEPPAASAPGDEESEGGPSAHATQELALDDLQRPERRVDADLDDAALFPAVSSSEHGRPDLDEVRGVLEADDADLFDQLDRAFEGAQEPVEYEPGPGFDPSEGLGLDGLGLAAADRSSVAGPPPVPERSSVAGPPPVPERSSVAGPPPAPRRPGPLGAPRVHDALRDASTDLPPAPPLTSTYLDTGGGHPSSDLELADALESDFGPSGGPFFPDEPGPAPFPPPSFSSDADDLVDVGPGHRPPPSSTGRVDPVRFDGDDDRTRVAETPRSGEARRRPSRWPTWLGLVVGLLVSATFIPGWAPEPLDQVAERVAEVLHPAARLRIPGALGDIRSESAVAFPYALGERTVVVVRGEAVNVGNETRADVVATVLMLDGDEEVGRASSPVGRIPTPTELPDWAPKSRGSRSEDDATLEPGERAPFLVVFPDVSNDAHRRRFRVEFETVRSSSPRRRAPPASSG